MVARTASMVQAMHLVLQPYSSGPVPIAGHVEDSKQPFSMIA